MPSNSAPSRRDVLGSLGTIALGSLAGCISHLPGTEPTQLTAETTTEEGEIQWQYPPREGDKDGIGYAAIEHDRTLQRQARSPVACLTFNSTIGGLAASDPYRGYQPEWFRFRIWPPQSYDGRLGYAFRVEPPGQWDGFSAYYDIRGTVKHAIIELRNVDTQGTILVPAVFDPGTKSLPARLHCSFTVQARRPGLLTESIRVRGRGTLELRQP